MKIEKEFGIMEVVPAIVAKVGVADVDALIAALNEVEGMEGQASGAAVSRDDLRDDDFEHNEDASRDVCLYCAHGSLLFMIDLRNGETNFV